MRAEAASEGGFLGIGGVQVSEAEKATLGNISKTLGISTWTDSVAGQTLGAVLILLVWGFY